MSNIPKINDLREELDELTKVINSFKERKAVIKCENGIYGDALHYFDYSDDENRAVLKFALKTLEYKASKLLAEINYLSE